MSRVNRGRMIFSISLITLLFVVSSISFAQEEKKDLRPERGIVVFTEYSGVAIPKGEAVKMDLTLENKGRKDETINVKISTIPKGWKATLKGGSYLVSGLFVPNGKSRNLALSLEPEKTLGPGIYDFQFDAQSEDGKLTSTHKLAVTVQERTPGLDDIQITTSYPVLRGQTDARFEFSLEVMNKIEVDRTFNLTAIGPEKWEINFKPSYEAKQISSIRIRGGRVRTSLSKFHPPGKLVQANIPFWSG